jgi:DNA uptake protein ComE-like DNA-binding protein
MKRIMLAVLLAGTPCLAKGPAPKQQSADKVNILTASADQIAQMPTVGQALAEHVVEVRTQHPEALKSCADLVKVKGFGAKKVAQALPYCTTTGDTTLSVKLNKAGQAVKGKAVKF